jgi:hypothetical protein
LLYFRGVAKAGDLYYTRSLDEGKAFDDPVRVNSQEGSAVASGTIRGGQIALGRNGWVHVAWNGSNAAIDSGPLDPVAGKRTHPMLYSRLANGGRRFEPQRNLMTSTWELDGGGSLAADLAGRVSVLWHGRDSNSAAGEEGRRVFVTRSADDGSAFSKEAPLWDRPTGACGCCGMRAFAARDGRVWTMYRSATRQVHRDIYLASAEPGASFEGALLHPWEINACPMSGMSFSEGAAGVVAAWETAGEVYFARTGDRKPIPATGQPSKRKHPVTAQNASGEILLAWVEDAGWQRAGTLAWRLFGADGEPLGEPVRVGDCPVWSFPAAFARRDGGFTILY